MDEDLTEVLREARLPDQDFVEVLDVLAEARAEPLPPLEPPPELAALWARGSAVPHGGGRRRRTAVLLAGLLGGLAAGTAAGAANALPEQVQQVVADFSKTFLPFEFPHPPQRPERDSPTFEVPDEPPVLSPTSPARPDPGRQDPGRQDPASPGGVPISGGSRPPDEGSPTPEAPAAVVPSPAPTLSGDAPTEPSPAPSGTPEQTPTSGPDLEPDSDEAPVPEQRPQ